MRPLFKIFSALVFIAIKADLFAQEIPNDFQKHSNIYISFGAGSSMLNQFPSDIYFAGSTNLQLGAMYERAFNKRFSLIAGIEFEQVSYNFDGDIDITSTSTLDLLQAKPEKKYTGIRQRNVVIPLQARFYFFNNNTANTRNMFMQSGIRLVQSLGFIDSDNLGTTYYYRSNGENSKVSLSEFTNQTALQMELMIGFKGDFFKRFDLLNASTLGFMYQFTPVFKDGSTEIYPLHFTWRFLF